MDIEKSGGDLMQQEKRYNGGRKGLNDRGFSFVEVLISILILALLATPLLKQFVTIYKVNSKSDRIQKDTFIAQNIVEDIKAKTFQEIKEEYKDPSGFSDVPNEVYYFAKKGIESNNKKYDALITMDASAYRVENPTDPSGEKIGYNTFEMPIIADINVPKNILAIESYETELAIAALYANHVNYIAEQRELHKDDPTYSITEVSSSDVREQLVKQMIVEINKLDGSIKVNVEFDFSAPTVDGCKNERYTITDKAFHAAIGNVYLFYYPSYSDQLTITKDITIIEDIDVYVVRQEPKTSTTTLPETLIGALPLGVNLYSNANFGVNSNPLVKKDEAKNRIYDVTVGIFPAGTDFDMGELLVEFHSTKEE